MKFIDALKGQRTDTLSADSIAQAQTMWEKDVQLSLKSSSKFRDWEKEFGLFADEKGIWRCGERLQHADCYNCYILDHHKENHQARPPFDNKSMPRDNQNGRLVVDK